MTLTEQRDSQIFFQPGLVDSAKDFAVLQQVDQTSLDLWLQDWLQGEELMRGLLTWLTPASFIHPEIYHTNVIHGIDEAKHITDKHWGNDIWQEDISVEIQRLGSSLLLISTGAHKLNSDFAWKYQWIDQEPLHIHCHNLHRSVPWIARLFMSFTNSTWYFTHKINDISWWCWCCIM